MIKFAEREPTKVKATSRQAGRHDDDDDDDVLFSFTCGKKKNFS